MAAALDRFSASTRAWFEATFPMPTPAQEQGWEAIGNGEHALILAPTGSGKTLAAFLWALDRLLAAPAPSDERRRLRVLYVSPLKALTYDVERNLRAPLAGIALESERLGETVAALRVSTRTGDTPQAERRGLARHPPDILITTPESLYLLLTSAAREALASVEHVIVDEIHAVAGTKRGAHLALSLERLDRLVHTRDPEAPLPQRIGLSATQRPLAEIAHFLGGCERDPEGGAWRRRPVTIVDAGMRKELELEVVVNVEDMAELGRALPGSVDMVTSGPGASASLGGVGASIWPSIYPRLLDLIHAHRSTLVFVNSRRLAERLATRLNELEAQRQGLVPAGFSTPAVPGTEIAAQAGAGWPVPSVDLVRAHHGSIAREHRLEIEDALKAGKLPALVATSSLELGIDMGAIDLVVQVEAPTSVASGLQRIGRAGHAVGEPSRGKVFPKFRGDLLVAAVTTARMHEGLIEETCMPRQPLDVLAQHIVAMVAVESMTVDEVLGLARSAAPFEGLSQALLEGVLDMLSGRYPSDEFAELRPRLTWDRVSGTLTPRSGARMLAVTSGGTIPDRGTYGVSTPEGLRVGELDEEMVYESRVGETFLLGASTWRIEEITRDRVVVSPAPGEPGKMPFWHGDQVGRPYELGRAIGAFVREVSAGAWDDARLARECGLDPWAVRNLLAYLDDQAAATGGLLPTDRQIVVERFRDELGDWRVCALSPFGAKVHAPWALAIEARIRDRLGLEVQCIWGDDGIVVRLPEADEAPPVESVILEPEEVEELVVGQVGSSALFAARFRDNAARALLLPRRRPGSRTPLWQQRQRAAELLAVASRYASFPILLETYRECLRDVFDLTALVELMRAIRAREVRVVGVDTAVPSPFAASLAFSYIANFMYEGDAPLAERRAQALTLDRRMLAELLGTEELRELIDPSALALLESQLQHVEPTHHARNLDAAHDLLLRLGDLSLEELAARCRGDAGPEWASALVSMRRAVPIRVAAEERLIAVEDAARYRDGIGAVLPPGIPEALLAPVADAVTSLVRRYARTHGPFLADAPAQRFGMTAERVSGALAQLAGHGTVVRGAFRPDGVEQEWCDATVLRALRQRSLAALRREIEPTEPAALARLAVSWHGIGSAAGGLDRLYEVVRQLQAFPIPASVLERDVLASRVSDYSPRLLDELCTSGVVSWVGAGSLGPDDGRVMLVLRESAPLVLGPGWTPPRVIRPDGPEHERLRELLAARGACFFTELVGVDAVVALEALWDLVWAGEVTNDAFAPLRFFSGGRRSAYAGSGVRHGRSARGRWGARPRLGSLSALGPPWAQGRWSLTSRSLPGAVGPEDALATRAAAARAGVLLERHGVLTREAVRAEAIPGGFAGLYPVLRAMEESGRARRGYFVAGLGGAQFALAGAVDRLRAHRAETNDVPSVGGGRVAVLAATDPANVYGLSLPWPAPPGADPGSDSSSVRSPARAAGAYVVTVDGLASLYLERGGRTLTLLRPADGTWEADAIGGMIQVLGKRFGRISLERVPPELEPALGEAGFVRTPKGLAYYA